MVLAKTFRGKYFECFLYFLVATLVNYCASGCGCGCGSDGDSGGGG